MAYEEAYELQKKKEPEFEATRIVSYRDLYLFVGEDTFAGKYDNWIRSVNKTSGEVSTFYVNPLNIEDFCTNSVVVKYFSEQI